MKQESNASTLGEIFQIALSPTLASAVSFAYKSHVAPFCQVTKTYAFYAVVSAELHVVNGHH